MNLEAYEAIGRLIALITLLSPVLYLLLCFLIGWIAREKGYKYFFWAGILFTPILGVLLVCALPTKKKGIDINA